MGSMDIMKSGGGSAGTISLDPTVFEAPVRAHLFHAEVRRQLAARRAGTHASRNRAGVSGGGAKPYRQKGTGRARQGTTRAPQYAGGGVVFGPVPRSHAHALPKGVRRAALRSALSLRFTAGDVVVAEPPGLKEFRTRAVAEWLSELGVGGSSTLVVVPQRDTHLEVSARNLPGVDVIRAEGLNVYDILRHQKLVLLADAVALVEARFARSRREAEEQA